MTQKTNCRNSWDDSEIDELAKALVVAYKTQNTFGVPLDISDRVAGWRFVLEGKYSVGAVLAGLSDYMENNSSMPVPADINKILSPPPVRITESEFVAAQKWQEQNYYPMFSEAKDTIDAYKKQQHETRINQREQVAYSGFKQIGKIEND